LVGSKRTALAQRLGCSVVTIRSPRSECLEDGRQLCSIAGMGHVSGDFSGAVTQEITHFKTGSVSLSPVVYMTVVYEVTTDAGSLKGYYAGFSTDRQDGKVDHLRMHGQVLSVTVAYIDLFMADIFYDGAIFYPGATTERAILEQGTLTILPR
jgi:hypothetical protein